MTDRMMSAALTFVSISIFAMIASAAQEMPGNGVTLPAVIHEVKPDYTPEAKTNRIQGSVWLTVVVDADGTVGSVQVSRSLDAEFGLDDQAVKAAKQWTFNPGTKGGNPVAVQITIEMTFTLK